MNYDGYLYPIKPEEAIAQQDRYKYFTGQKDYACRSPEPQAEDKASSIDSILELDSRALLDKVVNTSFNIVYRIKLYNDITKTIEYNRLKTSSSITQLYDWLPGTNMNVERRKSMLIKELHSLDRQKLEEKLTCWKDLTEPTSYLVSLFHKNQELKQDKKLLE
ncbi:MAG: hypothetical protein KAV87_53435 [Desulfobacteraceae bacterium]|nr:hypothetical protein [Desulfobacteraceae bacterium]